MRNRSTAFPLHIAIPGVLLVAFTCTRCQLANSVSAATNTFYVNPAGSDAANGSANSPWATIQHAANVAKAGATVHVAPGIYGAVKTSTSGTSTERIRFISDVKWGAKIRSTGISEMWYNKGNYVDIMGFDVSGDGRVGIANDASFIRIIGNNVHDIPGACDSNGGAGIDNGNYSASDNDIIGNVVHDIGNPNVKCNAVQGIYHSNLRGHILNNISYRNQAWGIHLWHAANNVVIANNLVFQNGEGGIVVGDGDSPGAVTNNNTVVCNNIVMDHKGLWGRGIAIAEEGATGKGNKYLNNLIWNNNRGIVLQNGLVDVNTISADPRLVHYEASGSGNYRPSGSSPAIAAGASNCAPVVDFDGQTRSAKTPPDIGPYRTGDVQASWPWSN